MLFKTKIAPYSHKLPLILTLYLSLNIQTITMEINSRIEQKYSKYSRQKPVYIPFRARNQWNALRDESCIQFTHCFELRHSERKTTQHRPIRISSLYWLLTRGMWQRIWNIYLRFYTFYFLWHDFLEGPCSTD